LREAKKSKMEIGPGQSGPSRSSGFCGAAPPAWSRSRRRQVRAGGPPQGNRVPVLADRCSDLPALGFHSRDDLPKRCPRLPRRPDREEAVRGERGGHQKWGRIAVGIELLGYESGPPRLAHDRDQGTPGAHCRIMEAMKSQLVPRSVQVDRPPSARLEARDEQLVGDPCGPPPTRSTEPWRTERRGAGDCSTRAVCPGSDHLELAVTT
jgi:hypothetical protein